jgi:anti-sigma factor RsiW
MTEDRTHDRWIDRLSEYLDGELRTRERRRLDRHLETCAECRATLDALRMVVGQAPALAREAPAESDLWPGIARRLTARRRPWWQRLLVVPPAPRLRLAAPVVTVAVVLALGAGLAWMLSRQREVAPAEVASGSIPPATSTEAASPAGRQYDDAVADLRRIVRTHLTSDPNVIDVLDRNLESIDMAIADYQDALASRPGDARLRGRWEQARQRKVEILRQAALLAAGDPE